MSVRILNGDALAMLKTLDAKSVQCVVTSPPYFQLRDYGVDGQIGLEATPAAFLDALVAVFREVRRVLRDDGVVFCNLGDSYAGSGKGPTGSNGIGDQEQRQGFVASPQQRGAAKHPKADSGFGLLGATSMRGFDGIRPKSLMLIPERFAIAMQDDGWIVRSQIVWAKKSAMPESVRDRCTSAWEPIWMFTKQARYFWDADAVRQPSAPASIARMQSGWSGNEDRDYANGPQNHLSKYIGSDKGKAAAEAGANLRNVWHLSPEPSRDEHFASFPTEIPRRCILAATSEKGQCPACGAPWRRVVERKNNGLRRTVGGKAASLLDAGDRNDGYRRMGDVSSTTTGWEAGCTCDAGAPVAQTVLDCFGGSGTTGVVADRLGRDAILIELSPTYAAMCERRLRADAGMFADVEVVA